MGLHRHRVGVATASAPPCISASALRPGHLRATASACASACERLLLHLLLPACIYLCERLLLPASTSASDCLTDFISALLLTIVLHQVEKGLSEAFSQYGQVIEAQIVSDRVSERSKGFGFVTFASEDEAHKALEKMNGKPLNGRVIFVDYAKPRTNYGSGMPIARGPPDSIKDGLSTYARSSIRWGALAGRIKCGENQIHVSLLYYLILPI
ncbi:glycine-rich RNA-binding protein 7-like [Malus domestica]|uniref:glycine-rich RNA-binding protein 7-like n=1 Tax=Malus domestica TaxID=3750 RepID=UPI00397714DE